MSMADARINGSDEFYDIHEEFFERYKEGATPEEIYRELLNEYQSEFEDEAEDCDHILMHEVCFALAWCLWECGAKDEWLWRKVQHIIESGDNLKHGWVDDPKVIRARERELQRFWQKINTPAKKPRLPRKERSPRKPTLNKGDLYAYAVEGGYRAALVLDFDDGCEPVFLTAISEEVFTFIPDENEAMTAHSHVVSWFSPRASIPKKDRKMIANLGITASYNNRAGLLSCETIFGISNIGERTYFLNLTTAEETMQRNSIGCYRFSELLDPEVLPKYNDRMP